MRGAAPTAMVFVTISSFHSSERNTSGSPISISRRSFRVGGPRGRCPLTAHEIRHCRPTPPVAVPECAPPHAGCPDAERRRSRARHLVKRRCREDRRFAHESFVAGHGVAVNVVARPEAGRHAVLRPSRQRGMVAAGNLLRRAAARHRGRSSAACVANDNGARSDDRAPQEAARAASPRRQFSEPSTVSSKEVVLPAPYL